MAYFDNAATTFPKPETVYTAMDEFYRRGGGSAGRGEYAVAKGASLLVKETRELIKDVLHCNNKDVVFTPSATIALNMIIQGLAKKGLKNFYISPFEHNAVTRVLHSMEKNGEISVFDLTVDQYFKYDFERIRYQFDNNRPDVVIVSHVSNVIGLISPIQEIFTLAKGYQATTVTDMAQSAGLIDINVGVNEIDFAVFAGHKTLYGPTGISGFVMKPDIDLPPILFGGTGFNSLNQDMPDSIPEKYEMGTLNILGIAGLNASLKWIKDISIERIYCKEIENRNKLLDILSRYDFISVIGNYENNNYTGIVSCLIEGISSDSAGVIFDQQNIAIRSGLQCSPKAHKMINTIPAGTIRFSVSYFTSDDDFAELVDALDYIYENI